MQTYNLNSQEVEANEKKEEEEKSEAGKSNGQGHTYIT